MRSTVGWFFRLVLHPVAAIVATIFALHAAATWLLPALQ